MKCPKLLSRRWRSRSPYWNTRNRNLLRYVQSFIQCSIFRSMDIFPTLRCLPRRTVLCLYLICMMFLACAFYTFYLDSGYSGSASNESILSNDELLLRNSENFEDNLKASTKIQNEEKINDDKGKKVENNGNNVSSPRYVGTTKSSQASFPTATSNQSRLSIAITGNSSHNKLRNSRISVHVETKYIYLNISTTRSSASSTIAPITSTPAPSPDTCQVSSMKDAKQILLWTPFFGNWEYLPKGYFNRCPRCRNCRVTKDRSKLHESDAVVFHARDMTVADLPAVRYPHQRWIFYCLESPPYSDFQGLQYMQNMFNWTMTYRLDSDIITQYGTISKVRPSRKLDLQTLESAWSNKSKSVVWMSSHCPTHGGRDLFVKELRKYIDVDVYGSCGTSVCPWATDRCLQEFAEKYKFFLAFENTVCKDYITEKFYRTLKFNIVPVVFGGAKYEKFAPPGSFVDALNFKSPKHLAFFLAGVGKDFKLYSTYFRWKKDFDVTLSNNKECTLCSLLHKKNLKPSSYSDLKQWWVSESQCRSWKPKR